MKVYFEYTKVYTQLSLLPVIRFARYLDVYVVQIVNLSRL